MTAYSLAVEVQAMLDARPSLADSLTDIEKIGLKLIKETTANAVLGPSPQAAHSHVSPGAAFSTHAGAAPAVHEKKSIRNLPKNDNKTD